MHLGRLFATAMSLVLLSGTLVFPDGKGFIKPAEKDKCPVCGMFVARYPDWVAEVAFTDGAYFVFDGPKDLYTYLMNMKKYAPGRKSKNIRALYVMDYYELAPINGYTAWYVMGSDVYGPMGAELIPFQKESDAREFLKDHKGSRILTFKEINGGVLKTLK